MDPKKANGADPKPDHQLSLPEARKRLGERAREIADLTQARDQQAQSVRDAQAVIDGHEQRLREARTSIEDLEKRCADLSAGSERLAEEKARAATEADLQVEQITQERDAALQEVGRLKQVAGEALRTADARAREAAAAAPPAEEPQPDSYVFALRDGFTDPLAEGAVEERYLANAEAVETLRLEVEATGRVWRNSPADLQMP